MLSVVKSYLQVKLGERGAEMVEYAIVLACVAAVGAVFYASSAPAQGSGAANTLFTVLNQLWTSIAGSVPSAS